MAKNKHSFRASSLGKCSPELLKKLQEPEEREDLKDNDRALFLVGGHALQAALEFYFELHDLDIIEKETELCEEFDGYIITGHLDNVTMINPDTESPFKVLNEVKWIMQKNFIKIKKDPKKWKVAYPHYADQLAIYMNLTGIEHGAMCIGNRNSGELVSPYSFPGEHAIDSMEMAMTRDEAEDRFEGIRRKIEQVIEAFEFGDKLKCDYSGWCFHCNSSRKAEDFDMYAKGGGDMDHQDRVDLIKAAQEAIESAG